MPEPLIHVPKDYELYIDSLIQHAYNSDYDESEKGFGIVRCPSNSQESQEQINFNSDSEGEDVFTEIERELL